jgi:3-phenylpropionate/cinnamic acid dioxygenase small subunit
MSDEFSPTPELQFSVEQFYYKEARLLDNRQYQQWLALVDEGIQYTMPARSNPLVDNRMRGKEEMISVERELENVDSDGCPLREENIIHLSLRVERAYKINSWAENPPARTRRIIGNVEITAKDGDRLSALNNFILYFARPGSDNFIYSGQRRDELLITNGSYKLAKREIIIDISKIMVPSMGLLF